MWEVLEGLYLGDREDSRDREELRRGGITHVVNCAAELPNCFAGELAYLALGLEDPDARFAERLPGALAFIDEGRKAGAVLVHCTGGVSRSAAVALAYLWRDGTALEAAAGRLAEAVLTGIDPSFLRQMARLRGKVLGAEELDRLSLILAGRLRVV